MKRFWMRLMGLVAPEEAALEEETGAYDAGEAYESAWISEMASVGMDWEEEGCMFMERWGSNIC